MRTFSLKRDLGIGTVYKSELKEVNESINNLDLFKTNEICLDLTGHYVDYQNTPAIISNFLEQLSANSGDKIFKIIHSGIGTKEDLMFYDLIFDNEYFGIKYRPTEDTLLDYIKIINKKLVKNRIVMIINCKYGGNTYTYGN